MHLAKQVGAKHTAKGDLGQSHGRRLALVVGFFF